MMMHIMQYSIDVLPDRAEEVMDRGYLAVVVVFHEHGQRDLAVREDGQHLRVHESARVALGARAEHLGGRGGAVVVVLHFAYYLTAL